MYLLNLNLKVYIYIYIKYNYENAFIVGFVYIYITDLNLFVWPKFFY